MALRARIASCFLIGAVLTAAPLCASAQGLSATDEANARFQTGLKYYDNHDFESARLAFKQAYAVLQKPSILLNLALSELYSNHPLEAIQHFEEYIRDPSTPGDKRDKAKKHLEDAMKKTSHLQIRTATDAQLTLDGAPVAPPYTTVHVMPGTHSLEARLKDKTKSASVNPKAGDTLAVDLQFEGEPTSPPVSEPPPNGSSSNQNQNQNPNTNPPPGGEPPPINPTPSSSSLRWIVPIGLGVAAIGGAVVGIVFAGKNESALDDAEALRKQGPSNICADRNSSQCQAYDSKLNDASSASTISTVGYIASGVLLAGAIATFIFWPKPTSSSAAKHTPMIAPMLTASSTGAFASFTF